MQSHEAEDEFEIDWMPVWPDEDGRLEPIFFEGPQWSEFAEAEPFVAAPAGAAPVEFEGSALLDPEAGSDEPEEPPPPPRQRAAASSIAASCGVHLVILLALTGWRSAPAEVAGGIPVQLVMEEPAAAAEDRQPGQLVTGLPQPLPQPDADTLRSAEPPAPPPPPPKTQVASIAPTVKPHPRKPPPPRPQPPAPPAPPVQAAKPAPAPPAQTVIAASSPIAAPAAAPPPAPPVQAAKPAPARPAQTVIAASPPVAAAPAAMPPPAPAIAGSPLSASVVMAHDGKVSGTAAGQGDYFAELEQLTRPYLYLLSPTFLAGRRGRATLTIAVGDDGTIGHIGVKRSSGYPDIDARIEQMVEAVGRFPPLPQQLRRPGAELDFNLVFPEVLQQ